MKTNQAKTKHTPGPWYVGAMNDALFVINEPPRPAPIDFVNTALKTKVIATASEPHHFGCSHEEYKANTNLIAAAPEMLEALRNLVTEIRAYYYSSPECGEGEILGPEIKAADAAIAKATGGAQ